MGRKGSREEEKTKNRAEERALEEEMTREKRKRRTEVRRAEE